MGDIENIELYECDRTNPHGGDLSIRVTYTPTGTLGWAGVYWQHPPNNWGEDESEGHDLTGAKRLEFWVRSEKGGEVVEFLVGGIEGDFGDTIQPALTTGPIVLSDTWKPVAISLSDADLSHVIGGFAWVASRCHNLEPITFFIDDIAFDFNFASLPPSLPEPEYSTFYVYEDANSGCNHFVPSGFMGDINDVTLEEAHTESPCGGTTAIEITYGAQGPNGWAGVYWQEPENNWGAIPDAGYNLDQFNALVFCSKGASVGDYIEFGAVG
jgi:hypothetical protein